MGQNYDIAHKQDNPLPVTPPVTSQCYYRLLTCILALSLVRSEMKSNMRTSRRKSINSMHLRCSYTLGYLVRTIACHCTNICDKLSRHLRTSDVKYLLETFLEICFGRPLTVARGLLTEVYVKASPEAVEVRISSYL